MKHALIVLFASGCAPTAAGIRREAAARVEGCVVASVMPPVAALAGCKVEGAKYCIANGQDQSCWMDEYTFDVLDRPLMMRKTGRDAGLVK